MTTSSLHAIVRVADRPWSFTNKTSQVPAVSSSATTLPTLSRSRARTRRPTFGVRPERLCPLDVDQQFGWVGVALALCDPLGVACLLRQVEQRGDRDLGGEIADACRLRIPRRDQLLGTRHVDSVDQFVLGVLSAFSEQRDAGGVPFGHVERLCGGAVDPGRQPGP